MISEQSKTEKGASIQGRFVSYDDLPTSTETRWGDDSASSNPVEAFEYESFPKPAQTSGTVISALLTAMLHLSSRVALFVLTVAEGVVWLLMRIQSVMKIKSKIRTPLDDSDASTPPTSRIDSTFVEQKISDIAHHAVMIGALAESVNKHNVGGGRSTTKVQISRDYVSQRNVSERSMALMINKIGIDGVEEAFALSPGEDVFPLVSEEMNKAKGTLESALFSLANYTFVSSEDFDKLNINDRLESIADGTKRVSTLAVDCCELWENLSQMAENLRERKGANYFLRNNGAFDDVTSKYFAKVSELKQATVDICTDMSELSNSAQSLMSNKGKPGSYPAFVLNDATATQVESSNILSHDR